MKEETGDHRGRSGATVLIVEDDAFTARLVERYLRRDGYEAVVCSDGAVGLRRALELQPALVVLDVMIPGIDGLAFCRQLREVVNTPVVFLTARTAEEDRLRGFALGADDYVTKPFSPGELVARVRAVLRRYCSTEHPPGPLEVRFGDLSVNYRTRTVAVHARPVHVTPAEYRLLCVFAREPGRAYTREKLVELVLDAHYDGMDRTIDAHIKNLRKKIEPDPAHPFYVQTVYAVGYRLNPECGR